jgi:hypothetical protein
MISRRALLTTTALGATALAVAGCSTAQITAFETQWASVASAVQQAVSVAAAYIPTIESVAATAASLFGPQYVTLVQVGSAAFNQVVAVLTNVVANLSPPASAHLMARLRASSPSVPVTIGMTAAGVTVHGWRS